METIWRAALAEFIGSFGFVFVGAGSVIVAGPYGSGLLGVALATGFAVAVMVSVTAPISGGHVNPAVTVGVWVAGKIGSARALAYVAAQFGGGIFASLLLRFVVPLAVWKAANLGTPVLATGIGRGKGILIEAVLAFFLVFTVFATLIDDPGPFPQAAGLIVGLVLAFDILVAGPFTGGAVNPVRSFGPALVSGTWNDWWVYWVGPVAGGVIGAVLYWSAFMRDREPAVP
ncbi:MAG TPA: aquaporin [Actinomycetota bacterium]|nr:aquaporin [Actinomycetota bacterium]